MFGEEKKSTMFLTVRHGKFSLRANNPDEERWGIKPEERTYKDNKGESHTVYEFLSSSIEGYLSNFDIKKTDFGEQIYFNMKAEQGDFTVAIAVESRYGRNFMEKIPNVNRGEKVVIKVYDFIDENGKNKSGLSIFQEDRIPSYYYDFDKKKYVNGHPAPGPDLDSDDWKLYFKQSEIFLKKATIKLFESWKTL